MSQTATLNMFLETKELGGGEWKENEFQVDESDQAELMRLRSEFREG